MGSLIRATHVSAPVGRGRKREVSVVAVDYVSLFETHDWPTPAVAEGSAVRRKVETLFCPTLHAALVGEATQQREPRVALSLVAAARRRGTRTRGATAVRKARQAPIPMCYAKSSRMSYSRIVPYICLKCDARVTHFFTFFPSFGCFRPDADSGDRCGRAWQSALRVGCRRQETCRERLRRRATLQTETYPPTSPFAWTCQEKCVNTQH